MSAVHPASRAHNGERETRSHAPAPLEADQREGGAAATEEEGKPSSGSAGGGNRASTPKARAASEPEGFAPWVLPARLRRAQKLVELDGIEPTTSSLQITTD